MFLENGCRAASEPSQFWIQFRVTTFLPEIGLCLRSTVAVSAVRVGAVAATDRTTDSVEHPASLAR